MAVENSKFKYWPHLIFFFVGGVVGVLLTVLRSPKVDESYKVEIARLDSLNAVYKDSLSLSDLRIKDFAKRDTMQNLVIDRQADRIRLINSKLYETHSQIDLYTPADIRAYLLGERLPVAPE